VASEQQTQQTGPKPRSQLQQYLDSEDPPVSLFPT
jgi:hypothetical protein